MTRSAVPARRGTSPARPTNHRDPCVSSRRDPNQPSSSTNRSIPTRGRRRRECAEPLGVVVEVHRLPRVQQHRTRRRRVTRPRAKVTVEAPRGRRQTVGGVDRDDLGRRVRLTRFERDLAGVEQLAESGRSADRRAVARRACRGCRSTPDATPQTSPCHSPNPAVPANSSGGCSCDVRPRQFSASTAPLGHDCRRGWNSRACRPWNVNRSPACSGSGSVTLSPSSMYRSSPSFVSDRPHHQHGAELERGGEPQSGDGIDRLDDEPAVGELVTGRAGSGPTMPGRATGDRATRPGPGSRSRARARPRSGRRRRASPARAGGRARSRAQPDLTRRRRHRAVRPSGRRQAHPCRRRSTDVGPVPTKMDHHSVTGADRGHDRC